jgi:hypothetical protein
MSSINIATLLNLLGFTTGAALYAMLLIMVFRIQAHIQRAPETVSRLIASLFSGNRLLLATAVLGLVWNLGALVSFGIKTFGRYQSFPWLNAVSFAALGFLPAVVVHSVFQTRGPVKLARIGRFIALAAYGLSALAALLHFISGMMGNGGVSDAALRLLTAGYILLIVVLIISTRGQPGWSRAVWASALAVFAVSALHLSSHQYEGAESWPTALLGHHASLPLALAILYQDYRFAFADIFLKRALALLLLVAVAFGLYVAVAAPLLSAPGQGGALDPRATGVLIGLWVLTALVYPGLRQGTIWFVDTVVLRRANYSELRGRLAQLIAAHESPDLVLDEVCRQLGPALTASGVTWQRADSPAVVENSEIAAVWFKGAETDPRAEAGDGGTHLARGVGVIPDLPSDQYVTLLERSPGVSAVVFVPTAEPPYFTLTIGELAGGRRLLSDDMEMLNAVAVMTARRLDALRVTHERCEQGLREQEISKLATEAQLRALRAQVNPHFLFNALTTIGYLIKTSPDRAVATLMKLTDLLRRVLRSTGEFVTLGEELKLIESYLDIERERFEERLRANINVPPELMDIRLPPLLIQPLVENAIKHGIAPSRMGGEVSISAGFDAVESHGHAATGVLRIEVRDTGAGASDIELARGRRRGVGLSNIEERLRCYCGPNASLRIETVPGAGAAVCLELPVVMAAGPQADQVKMRLYRMEERKGA